LNGPNSECPKLQHLVITWISTDNNAQPTWNAILSSSISTPTSLPILCRVLRHPRHLYHSCLVSCSTSAASSPHRSLSPLCACELHNTRLYAWHSQRSSWKVFTNRFLDDVICRRKGSEWFLNLEHRWGGSALTGVSCHRE
jgi:hypothetical protein